jgi:uncharacterized MAPEG superfamily protein
MKRILIAIAGMLLAAARARADQVMRTHAEPRTPRDEVYTSNAGGWN